MDGPFIPIRQETVIPASGRAKSTAGDPIPWWVNVDSPFQGYRDAEESPRMMARRRAVHQPRHRPIASSWSTGSLLKS